MENDKQIIRICKENRLYIGLILMLVGLFIFPFLIRKQFVMDVMHSEKMYLWVLNPFILIGELLILRSATIEKKKKYGVILLSILSMVLVLVSTRDFYSQSVPNWLAMAVLFFVSWIMPYYLFFVDFPQNGDIIEKAIRIVLVAFTIYTVFLAIWGMIDWVNDRAATKWIAHFFGYLGYFVIDDYEGRRLASFLGHPLINATFANMVYGLWLVKPKEKTKEKLLFALAFVTCLIINLKVAGKTGICVFALLSLMLIVEYPKAIFALIAIVIAGLPLGLFDLLISRIGYTDLTTGRAGALMELLTDERFPFHFLYGYGNLTVVEGIYTNTTFEFPVVQVAFRYGILAMLLLLVVPFLYMTFKLCKKKTWKYYWCFLWIFAELNAFDAICCQPQDYGFLFGIYTLTLLWMAKEKNEKSKMEQFSE